MSTAERQFVANQPVAAAPADMSEDDGPVTRWGSLRPLSAKVAWGATVAHIMAMLFALAGILYVIPNLSKFVTSSDALRVYDWGMSYGGATHMILGAIAVFAMGVLVVGARRTLLFFVLAYLISASSELIGTSTGWPFGNYAYTDFLGYRLVDQRPLHDPTVVVLHGADVVLSSAG